MSVAFDPIHPGDVLAGQIEAVLTLRTGNAWVHVWAYHAFAPPALVDTPLMVRIFGIR